MTYIQSAGKRSYMEVSSNLFADWRFDGDLLDSSPNAFHLAAQSGVERFTLSPLGLGKCLHVRNGNYYRLADPSQELLMQNFALSRNLVAYMCVRPTQHVDLSASIFSISGNSTQESTTSNILFYVLQNDNSAESKLWWGGEYGSGSNSIMSTDVTLPPEFTAFAVSKEAVDTSDILKLHTAQGVIATSAPMTPVDMSGNNALFSVASRNPFTEKWTGQIQQLLLQDTFPGDAAIQSTLKMIG